MGLHSGEKTKVKIPNLIIVPILAFDKYKYRLGYGKGFYDIFLDKCRKDTLKIGLSFFGAEEEPITDVHENDVKLDYCITPGKVYAF